MTDEHGKDRFAALFEGNNSDVLSAHRGPPEATSKAALAKQTFAENKKVFTTPQNQQTNRRLPPGQAATRNWPVLDLGEQPVIMPEDWRLSVAGLVERPVRWTWEDLMAQPQTDLTADIHCVTAWSKFDHAFRGVSAGHFLDVVRPKPEARFIVFHGADGYTTNLPLSRFQGEDTLIAHEAEGKPLGREHGGPVRIVAPSLYFWKSAKWLRHMVFLDRDLKGYWETRGYHNDADPWKEQRHE